MKRVLLLLLIMVIILFATAPPAQALADTNCPTTPVITAVENNNIIADANVSEQDTWAFTSGAPPDSAINRSTAIGIKQYADGLALTAPDYYFMNLKNTDALTESGYSSTSSANNADLDVSGIRLCAFKNEATMADHGLTARLSRH